MKHSLATSVFLWLLRMAPYLAFAYGVGFTAGYFTDLPAATVSFFIGAGFVLHQTWREKRVVTRRAA